MSIRRLHVSLLVAAICLAVAGAPTPAHAANCPSLKMFVVRGSGEHSGYGHTLGKVVSGVYARVGRADGDATEYPAVDLPWKLPVYNRSVGRGISALREQIRTFLRDCHRTPLYLIGYSQGAQVVGDVYLGWLSDAERKRVDGVVLFGDPKFWGGQNAPINVGTFDMGRNGIAASLALDRPRHLWVTKRDGARVRSYCLANDPICSYTSGDLASCLAHKDTCSHMRYDDDYLVPSATYTQHAARFIISRFKRTAPPEVPGTPPQPPDPTPIDEGPVDTPVDTAPQPTVDTGITNPTVPAGTHAETVGGVTHTWTNYTNAGGTEGPTIQTGQTVGIECKLQGFKVADGNTWWYKIASSPWNGAYYASADAFYNNGATSGSLLGTPWVDPAVPDCTTPPPPPPPPAPTWSETVGGNAHTWTNYTNAGGTAGAIIPAYTTVQIACKVTGFRVSDGNTWWYRIASSPWNNQFYVSADAFYNNGATSGSLLGTPWVDPAVPNC